MTDHIDAAIAKLTELEAAANSNASDPEETCTQKPDCPEYKAEYEMRQAQDSIAALGPEVLRLMEALAQASRVPCWNRSPLACSRKPGLDEQHWCTPCRAEAALTATADAIMGPQECPSCAVTLAPDAAHAGDCDAIMEAES